MKKNGHDHNNKESTLFTLCILNLIHLHQPFCPPAAYSNDRFIQSHDNTIFHHSALINSIQIVWICKWWFSIWILHALHLCSMFFQLSGINTSFIDAFAAFIVPWLSISMKLVTKDDTHPIIQYCKYCSNEYRSNILIENRMKNNIPPVHIQEQWEIFAWHNIHWNSIRNIRI